MSAALHTTGARVRGTYMGVPITGTVIDSLPHFYRDDRFDVRVDLDAEAGAAVAEAGYLARERVVVAVRWSGAALDASGGFDTDWLEVVS